MSDHHGNGGRERSFEALRASEELHRATLINISDAVFLTDDNGVFTFVCPNVDVIFEYVPDEVHAMERIDRLIGERLFDPAQLASRGEIRNIECEATSKSGERRDLLVHVKRVAIQQGTVLYSCRDVTDRKRAEEALRGVSGRLISAYEQDRIRLARELHDDVTQRLSLLSLELDLLGEQLAESPVEHHDRVRALSIMAKEVASDLHRFAHQLHPARLQQLGLDAAIRGFCNELATAHHFAIDVDIDPLPVPLSPDVTLCLYRVTQEALHNVVKHSGGSTATVRLGVVGPELHLTIADRGMGFDTRAAHEQASLGLVSMRERVRLVHGKLLVESTPGAGTQVVARVPSARGEEEWA
jgi:PAS domain S-box-containing protein